MNINFFENEEIKKLINLAKNEHIPIMQKESACFLRDILLKSKPKKILEIGTAIGFSGLMILKTLENCELTTIEIDEYRYNIAKENFGKFGVSERTRCYLKDAKIIIEDLLINNEKFDFIFLDGPKGQQFRYYATLKKLLNLGGVLFVDDIYYHKNFLGENGFVGHKHRSMVTNLIKFISLVDEDEIFEKKYYDIDEGVLVAKKIK